mmetsp:Transcript_6549/g.13912  ORF Transcript_6549/g.13912 Transcript_6549/m.13912 type:complete len:111 (+) Transcript_6549:974-1306(+)
MPVRSVAYQLQFIHRTSYRVGNCDTFQAAKRSKRRTLYLLPSIFFECIQADLSIQSLLHKETDCVEFLGNFCSKATMYSSFRESFSQSKIRHMVLMNIQICRQTSSFFFY